MAAAEAEVEQRDEVIAARDRQAAELHKRCREAKEELKETRNKGDEASRAAKNSERQEGKTSPLHLPYVSLVPPLHLSSAQALALALALAL